MDLGTSGGRSMAITAFQRFAHRHKILASLAALNGVDIGTNVAVPWLLPLSTLLHRILQSVGTREYTG